jgi:sulfate adenylyltransferase subunit 1
MILRLLEMDDINKADVPTLDLRKLGIGEEHFEAIEKAVMELSRQGLEIKIKK